MKFLLKIWIILTAGAIVIGCRKVEPYTDSFSGKESAETVYISLKMDIAGGGIPESNHGIATRAGAQEEHRTLGTSSENRIKTVDLLVYDAESGKLIDIVSLSPEQIQEASAAGGTTEGTTGGATVGNGVKVPLYVSAGQKIHVYAAVNLTPQMRRNFIIGQTGTAVSVDASGVANDYSSIMDVFVPNSQGRQAVLRNNAQGCIPMTGQFTADNNAVITITDEMKNPDNALLVNVRLSRIVAKVLVIAKTTTHTLSNGQTVDYVYAQENSQEQSAGQADPSAQPSPSAQPIPSAQADPSGQPDQKQTIDFSNWMGWIRLAGVRYMPNGINKSTYVIPQRTDSYYKDLNMNLEDYILSGAGRDLKFDSALQTKDFCYYDNVSLHRWNINTTLDPGFTGFKTGMEVAGEYDKDKLDKTLSDRDYADRYVDGMYCLENYFDAPTDGSTFSGYEQAIPMVTHVTVAAKLTPRNIVVVSDFKAKMDQLIKDLDGNEDDFFNKYKIHRDEFSAEEIDRWHHENDGNGIERYFSGSEKYPLTHYPNDSFLLIRTDTEADAVDILNWSMKANGMWSSDKNDFEQDTYPTGTFFAFDMKDKPSISAEAGTAIDQRYMFLTAGAVASAKGDDFYLKAYSVPHIGGWGYYYTYIEPFGTGQAAASYTTSYIERNTYYILTINNFSSPGGLGTNPEYIKVNTEAVGWDYEGRGDIILH